MTFKFFIVIIVCLIAIFIGIFLLKNIPKKENNFWEYFCTFLEAIFLIVFAVIILIFAFLLI